MKDTAREGGGGGGGYMRHDDLHKPPISIDKILYLVYDIVSMFSSSFQKEEVCI